MSAEISGHTRLCCLFGDPVEHSLSPWMHNTAFERAGLDYRYLAFRVDAENIGRAADAVRLMNIRGFNLTMPDKIAIIPFLDKLDTAAELIGAVNTVVNDDGVLTGYNTDGYGFMQSFIDHGTSVAGKKIVLLGMGGAGTSVAVQAALDGARELVVFSPGNGKSWNRASQEVALIAEKTDCKAVIYDVNDHETLRREIATADLLGNMTPLGMGALEGQSAIADASFLHPGLIVQDAIYKPEETALLKMAREAGCTTINGLHMLFHQGARAFELWTGVKMPVEPEELRDR